MNGLLALENLLPASALVLAFLLGSLPFGLWIGRLYHVQDVRTQGSGNVGATNVARVAGRAPGAWTLLLDALKGALAVAIAVPAWSALWIDPLVTGTGAEGLRFTLVQTWLAALAAVLGHCYSPWLRFRGGKGVATALGAVAVLSPGAALAGVLAYALAFLATRTSSVGSLAGLATAAAVQLILQPMGLYLLPGLALLYVILLRHEGNLDALLESRERTF
jgi:glycerol-3-phosphate acyltransferase PlsY